jgi:hypothetical protein
MLRLGARVGRLLAVLAGAVLMVALAGCLRHATRDGGCKT